MVVTPNHVIAKTPCYMKNLMALMVHRTTVMGDESFTTAGIMIFDL